MLAGSNIHRFVLAGAQNPPRRPIPLLSSMMWLPAIALYVVSGAATGALFVLRPRWAVLSMLLVAASAVWLVDLWSTGTVQIVVGIASAWGLSACGRWWAMRRRGKAHG